MDTTLLNATDQARERRKQDRLARLGTQTPVCILCAEIDVRCLEQHHIAGRAHDEGLAIVCRNCHRKLSDDQKDNPTSGNKRPTPLENIGYFLLGLADLFKYLAESLRAFGQRLIALAGEINSEAAERQS